ncbi:MAG: hypothetical protein JW966_13305 [Anaerolineae bacterium]|nr:hypothetical protein [Anaerolineae bacterium]
MKPAPTFRSPLVWMALIALAFVLGIAVSGPSQSTHADTLREGQFNDVYEITSAANVPIYTQPNDTSMVLDTLYWGDRVLWTGVTLDANGWRWMKVGIGDGRTGYMKDLFETYVSVSPVFTTPGMGQGAMVQVTQDGSGSHCRMTPSSISGEMATVQTGNQLTVVGGPYQAEYWIWWQYRLNTGVSCWIVDVPGWFNVVRGGEF